MSDLSFSGKAPDPFGGKGGRRYKDKLVLGRFALPASGNRSILSEGYGGSASIKGWMRVE